MSQTNAYAGPVFKPDFGIFHDVSDDSYRRGYADGETAGERAGYEAGQQAGYAAGQLAGMEQGIQAEYDRFWDAYQQNGNRTDYDNLFSGTGWTDETFQPKYDIVSSTAYMIFRKAAITDLGEALRKSGKRLIIKTNTLQLTFNYTKLTRIDNVEFAPIYYMASTFNNSNSLKEIQTLPIAENATNLDGFNQLPALETISFSGVIPVNISFKDSPLLTNDSVQSIIDHLKDLTGKTAQTLTVHAAVGAKLTEVQKATVTAKNWTLVY